MVADARHGTLASGAGGGVRIAMLGVVIKGLVGATPPRGSDDQARQPFQHEPQDGLIGISAG